MVIPTWFAYSWILTAPQRRWSPCTGPAGLPNIGERRHESDLRCEDGHPEHHSQVGCPGRGKRRGQAGRDPRLRCGRQPDLVGDPGRFQAGRGDPPDRVRDCGMTVAAASMARSVDLPPAAVRTSETGEQTWF